MSMGGGSDNNRRSEHSEQRRGFGRRVGPAFNDAQRARQSDVFMQPDGRYVVRGPRGREHIFEPNGELVTSIDRSHRAHQDKIIRGERQPVTVNEFERLEEIFK